MVNTLHVLTIFLFLLYHLLPCSSDSKNVHFLPRESFHSIPHLGGGQDGHLTAATLGFSVKHVNDIMLPMPSLCI